MKITITRETLGRVLGVVLLLALVNAAAYGALAWSTWETNPAAWGMLGRCMYLGIVALLLLARSIEIARSDEE